VRDMSGQPVKSEAELRMKFETESAARLVEKSLQPDNEPLPKGLRIGVKRKGRLLVFKVSSERPLMSLLATLDDVIASAALVLKVIQAVE